MTDTTELPAGVSKGFDTFCANEVEFPTKLKDLGTEELIVWISALRSFILEQPEDDDFGLSREMRDKISRYGIYLTREFRNRRVNSAAGNKKATSTPRSGKQQKSNEAAAKLAALLGGK